MILGMTASGVYSFTDTLFVSMLGDTGALAAVPMALPFSALVMGLIHGPKSAMEQYPRPFAAEIYFSIVVPSRESMEQSMDQESPTKRPRV